MKQTQQEWIVEQLKKKGFITRNEALKKYISRLAARISDLREAGMEIIGERTPKGDYKYTLVK